MTDQAEMGSTRRRKRSSGRVEWNTPRVVLDCVAKLGPVAMDPCWNERCLVDAASVETVDGLGLDWREYSGGGLVYVNPPYGSALSAGTGKRPGKKRGWALKILEEAKAGAEIIGLVPNSTETVWFRKLFCASQAAMSWEGRLTFDGAPAPAFFGSVLFYFGHRPYAFADAFSAHAYCIKLTPKLEAV